MNRLKTAPFLLVAIVSFTPSSFAKDDSVSELTGIFRNPKNLYQLELIGPHGGTRRIHLRGDMLKDVPEGTRIWVQGKIQTRLLNATKSEASVQWTRHWRIFMIVEEYRKISKPFERPER